MVDSKHVIFDERLVLANSSLPEFEFTGLDVFGLAVLPVQFNRSQIFASPAENANTVTDKVAPLLIH